MQITESIGGNGCQLPLSGSAILFGSGVSCWKPSSAPTGQEISSALLDTLFDDDVLHLAGRNRTQHDYNFIPFEVINQHSSLHVEELNHWYGQLLEVSAPNPLHYELASVLISGLVSALITTNYDTGVEQAAQQLGHPVDPIPGLHLSGTYDMPFLKVHGSCSDPRSLVTKLAQESQLPAWKAQILLSLLRGRALIIIGYSGLDFEICPAIARSEVKEVWWLDQPGLEANTPGIRLIGRTCQLRRISWDLRFGMPWNPNSVALARAVGSTAVTRAIPTALDRPKRRLWAVRIAHGTGDARLALALIKSEGTRSDLLWSAEIGFVHFQAGQYKQAAHAFAKYACRELQRLNLHEAAVYWLHASTAWNAYGSVFRYFMSGIWGKVLATMVFKRRSRLPGRSAKWTAELIQRMGVSGNDCGRTRKVANRLVIWAWNRVRSKAHVAGDMYLIRQAEAELRLSSGHELAVDTYSDIYEQLGMRNQLAVRGTSTAHRGNEEELSDDYALAQNMSNHPMAFRIASQLAQNSSGESLNAWMQAAREHLHACEYSPRKTRRIDRHIAALIK